MAQDIVADGLNQIMNARRVEKTSLTIGRYSKVLINILELMKSEGHIDYSVDEPKRTVTVEIKKLNKCRAVKPRYYATVDDVTKYARRYLPSRNFGSLVVSTNKGLRDYKECLKQNVGGSIIAYYY